MLTFSHALLARRDFAEVRRYAGLLRRLGATPTPYCILHDPAHACCRRERWEDTDRALVAATLPEGASMLNVDLTGGRVLGRGGDVH